MILRATRSLRRRGDSFRKIYGRVRLEVEVRLIDASVGFRLGAVADCQGPDSLLAENPPSPRSPSLTQCYAQSGYQILKEIRERLLGIVLL